MIRTFLTFADIESALLLSVMVGHQHTYTTCCCAILAMRKSNRKGSNMLSLAKMKRRVIFATTTAMLALVNSPVLAQEPAGIPGVLAPNIIPELVQEGFRFTEGPVGKADGGLYFSDIPANRTYQLDLAGKITVVREQSNGSNGLALTKDGDILFAEAVGKRVSKRTNDGEIIVLTEGALDTPFLGPNDLISDERGGIYFTDPGRGPFPLDLVRPTRVYYLPFNANVAVVIDAQVPIPNGLTLTNDGKTLIVNNSHGPAIFGYDVQINGTATNRRTLATLRDIPPDKPSGADGMAIDSEDRLYVTSAKGIQVFDRSGYYLGTIPVPRQPTNVAFAGPSKQTLYITAREGLYRLQLLSKGPARLGK
jgi:gluconolactonase